MASCLKPTKFGNCRKCSSCLDKRMRSWLFRLILEGMLYDSDSILFVTLTYSPENLPVDISSCKVSFQSFLKRLRYYFGDNHIRYAAALEVGSNNTKRFHWHAILFGIRFSQVNRHFINKAWGLGFTNIQLATPGRMSYILKYIIKDKSAFLMSRKPGLGDGMLNQIQEGINKISKQELIKLRSFEGVLEHVLADNPKNLTALRSGKYYYPIHQFIKERVTIRTVSGALFNRAKIRSQRKI